MAGAVLSQFGVEALLATFMLFCRVGTCLMVVPGFGSDRVPVKVRLFVAVSASLALAPMLAPQIQAAMPASDLGTVGRFILSELFTGLLIGLMGRCFIAGLEMIGTFIAMSIGLSNMPGMAIEGNEGLPPLASLMTVTATAMIFITNQHWELFRALAQSYNALPPGAPIDPAAGLAQLTDRLSDAFWLALRIGSPFVIYAVVINFALGLLNKLTPQIPVYFIATPFLIAGGMYFLFVILGEAITLFLDGYASWLRFG
ncbi:flagellar biosynthesis protein FliR [Pannonibacter sp. Pt2-lr]|uniref:Flagellar biosynthesis protein FliR n=1 Tax=Pannonibacter anstelovis TaxID=3121537 RepID=A0ABU7ZSM5_9HYPH